MTGDELLDALADLVLARIDARTKTPARDLYSSEDLPPDVRTRARFHKVVKAIPGAEKRGRRWFISVDAWRAARTKKRSDVATDFDDVDAIIAGAGFRSTR